jgi:uncharacterized membrane protein
MLSGNGFAVSRNLNPNLVRIETLKPLGRETRKHPPAQIRKLQASIEQFGPSLLALGLLLLVIFICWEFTAQSLYVSLLGSTPPRGSSAISSAHHKAGN